MEAGSEEQGSPVAKKTGSNFFSSPLGPTLQRGHRAKEQPNGTEKLLAANVFHFTEAFRHGAIAVALSHEYGTAPPPASQSRQCSGQLYESVSCFKPIAFLSLFHLSQAPVSDGQFACLFKPSRVGGLVSPMHRRSSFPHEDRRLNC